MSAAVAPTSRAWREAVARSALYAFLAHSLAYPTEERRRALREEVVPVLRGARSGDPEVDGALAAALEAASATASELLPAYRKLFPAVGQGELVIYESVCRTRDLFQESEVLADLSAFYRAHGLVVGATERERPDHIAVELEFMAFLARKRAHAIAELGPREQAVCRQSERAFLREHLGTWAPLVGVELARGASHPTYRTLGMLLERWVTRDRPTDTADLGDAPAAPKDARPLDAGEDECPLEVLA